MAVDKNSGTLVQRGSYSISRRRGNTLSININVDMEDGRQFLRRLEKSLRYSLRQYLNQDSVNLVKDLRNILTARVTPTFGEEANE